MKRILVVDDEEMIRELFSDELSDAGYRVITAESAEDALDKMSFGMPDLIILDIRMPGKTGLELLEDVRRNSANVPVIICTALRGLHDDYTIWEGHVAAYLNKPVDLNELRAKVQEAIGPAV